jgi:hypothetical protein
LGGASGMIDEEDNPDSNSEDDDDDFKQYKRKDQ